MQRVTVVTMASASERVITRAQLPNAMEAVLLEGDGRLRVAIVSRLDRENEQEVGSVSVADGSRQSMTNAVEEAGRLAKQIAEEDEFAADALYVFAINDRNCHGDILRVVRRLRDSGDVKKRPAEYFIERDVIPVCLRGFRREERQMEAEPTQFRGSAIRRAASLMADHALEIVAHDETQPRHAQREPIRVTAVPQTFASPAQSAPSRGDAMSTTAHAPAGRGPRSKTRTKTISDEVMDVLRDARVDSNAVHLTGNLDPSLYRRVADALESAGAKWSRNEGAHTFRNPKALEAFLAMRDSGRVTIDKGLSFFETPRELAKRIARLSGARLGHRILEPSAGRGAIVRELLNLGAEVVAVEADPGRAKELRALAAARGGLGDLVVVEGDFLAMSSRDLGGRFDGVAMNPPFSLGGQPQADAEHVMHAASLAKSGASVVAVTSSAVAFRGGKLAEDFRRLVAEGGGSIEELPSGTFRPSGTDANASLVTFRVK